MPWQCTHLPCQGTGTVQNDYFEYCRDMENPPKDCRECKIDFPETFTECCKGEIIACEGCNGTGKLILDSDEWEAPVWL